MRELIYIKFSFIFFYNLDTCLFQFYQFAYGIINTCKLYLWSVSFQRHLYFRYVNVAFICVVFAVSVYNGASFYIGKSILFDLLLIIFWSLDVFSRQYIKSLELLQGLNDPDAKDTSSSISSQKSSQTTTTDTSENAHKKRS